MASSTLCPNLVSKTQMKISKQQTGSTHRQSQLQQRLTLTPNPRRTRL